MELGKIEEELRKQSYHSLIDMLETEMEEEYIEVSMLGLCQAYLAVGEEKKAKKLVKRMKMLFPSGEYLMEADELLEAIENNSTSSYMECLRKKLYKDSDEGKKASASIQSTSLATLFTQNKKQEKKQIEIPESIEECFENVVGMESVKIELDKFYKLLRFQNERMQNDLQEELLKSTHFMISGAVGCGKTLVAIIIARLLCDFGVRESALPSYLEASRLIHAYEGDKADGITKLLEELEDETLIIENIQDIYKEELDDGTRKGILQALETVMKDRKEDLSILITGTPECVKDILLINERMQDSLFSVLEIQAYSVEELMRIMKKLMKNKDLMLHPDAENIVRRRIDMERKSGEFMNAISLKRMISEATSKMAARYYEGEDESEEAMMYLMAEDFEEERETEDLEELLRQLDELVGLHGVKAQVKKRIQAVITQKQAEAAGAVRKTGNGSLHMLFVGNPGTGKTTVARLIGRIYQQMGVLPRGGNMVECTRSDLVGQYQGHTAKQVKEKVREAMGGVLFIDEAYSLCRDDQDTFGHEAVDELIAAMENNKDSMMVILAGYCNEMEEFLKSNPGFNSRIRNRILFEDYSVDEMTYIFKSMVKAKNMYLDNHTDGVLKALIEAKSSVPDFGNARGIRNLFEEVLESMNERLLRLQSQGEIMVRNQYDIILVEDLQAVLGRKWESEKTLEELLEELHGLTGLECVKQKVQEMVDDIQVKEYMKNMGLSANGYGTLHLVFKGNAGTGKTTVARLIGKIYKRLGILQKDVFIEVGRKDLVANYMGQTASKVIKKVKEAEGGILFIDEAYTLVGGERDEFGLEAVNTLVAELENRRENLMVIVAGYADEMQRFLDANQGLSSRLSNEIIFDDYSDEELLQIFVSMTSGKGMCLEAGIENIIMEVIKRERQQERDFGNARGIRNMVERVEKKKNTRVAQEMRAGRTLTKQEVITLTREDFE